MTGPIRELAHKWIRAEKEGARTHKAVLRLLRTARGAGSLLDVGCGSGAKAVEYAALLGIPSERVSGIEPQGNYADQADKKFRTYRVDIETGPFPVPDESFDLVVCNQVLEHLKNIFRPLGEMDRVVKTGGFLLIGVPNMAGFYNRMLLLLGRQPLSSAIDGPHVRGFAHVSFSEFLARNHNFELVASGGSNLYPLPYWTAPFCLNRISVSLG